MIIFFNREYENNYKEKVIFRLENERGNHCI